MADAFDLTNPKKPRAPEKDPGVTLDYSVNWTAWLADISDTLTACEFTVPAPLVRESQAFTSAGVCTVFVSGGVAGAKYQVTCRITTAGGRTDERTFTLPIKHR